LPHSRPAQEEPVLDTRATAIDDTRDAPLLATCWQVRLLGGLELRCGDLVLTHLSSRSVTALLARLALRPGQRQSREQLTELIWPDVSPDVGRNRFRTALAMLRRVLEPPGWAPGSVLAADRLTVQWNPAALRCDVAEFERLAREGDVEAARQRYGGELLPGFYDEWIIEERDRLQAVHEALGDRAAPAARADVAVAPPPALAPTASAKASGSALPAALGSFFGRGAELADLSGALASHRLVTLTGIGGAGKTRLATEAARAATGLGHVAFVALAECDAAQEIIERVRAALQLPDNGAQDAAKVLDQVAAHLDDTPALLILDNYEQLVEEGGVPVVEALLERLPRLRLLVTSRRALRLPVECEIALTPLALPDPAASLESSAGNPGVALFVERARDVRRDFQLSARNVAEVVRICRLLEGLPLAIELAAAKVRAYSLADMSQALATRRSEVLRRTATSRAGHRHASLHAAIDWSWRLLAQAQQQFLMALTVFRGGWTADAAQAVSGLPHPRELLESLVVDSLVQARPEADGGLRFSMLETVREFAREQLPPAEAELLRRRHRAWFLGQARAASERQEFVDDVTQANLLAAIASALEDGEPAEAVQLALALQMQWMSLGTAPQVRALLRRVVDEVPPQTARLVTLVSALSRVLLQAGESEDARRQATRALAMAHEGRDLAALADASFTHARIEWFLSRSVRPSEATERAMALAREAGATHLMAQCARLLAGQAAYRKDIAASDALYAQSEAWHLASNDRRGALLSRQGRVRCLVATREFAKAIDQALAGIEEAQRLGHVEAELLFLDQLGMAYANARRDADALAVYRRQTQLARQQHKVYLISYGLWNQALPLARLRRPQEAATIMAFSQRYWTLHFAPLLPDEQRHVDKVCKLVALQIGAPAMRLHWERGLTLPMSEALDLGCHGDAAAAP
jgi:predicted ATPase